MRLIYGLEHQKLTALILYIIISFYLASDLTGDPLAHAQDGQQPIPNISTITSQGTQSLDLLANGKSATKIVRGADGTISMISIDTDGKGTPDVVIDYDKRPQEISYYDKGQLVRRVTFEMTPMGHEHTVDTVLPLDNKQAITRITYDTEKESPTITVTHETDPNRNGTFIVREPAVSLPKAVATSSASLTKSGPIPIDTATCNDPTQITAIENAITQMMSQGLECLKNGNSQIANLWLVMLALDRIHITCLPQPSNPTILCAEAIDSDAPQKGLFMKMTDTAHYYFGGYRLAIYPAASTPVCARYSLAETLFHESLHYLFGPHLHPEMKFGADDPNDPVYQCQRTCFGKKTQESCSVCFGVPASAAICLPPPHLKKLVCPSTPPKSCTATFAGPVFSGSYPCKVGLRPGDPISTEYFPMEKRSRITLSVTNPAHEADYPAADFSMNFDFIGAPDPGKVLTMADSIALGASLNPFPLPDPLTMQQWSWVAQGGTSMATEESLGAIELQYCSYAPMKGSLASTPITLSNDHGVAELSLAPYAWEKYHTPDQPAPHPELEKPVIVDITF